MGWSLLETATWIDTNMCVIGFENIKYLLLYNVYIIKFIVKVVVGFFGGGDKWLSPKPPSQCSQAIFSFYKLNLNL